MRNLNSTAGNSYENKNAKQFNWQKGASFKFIFPVPYPIIYKPGKEYLAEKNWLDLEKINSYN